LRKKTKNKAIINNIHKNDDGESNGDQLVGERTRGERLGGDIEGGCVMGVRSLERLKPINEIRTDAISCGDNNPTLLGAAAFFGRRLSERRYRTSMNEEY